ncbi:MAG: hypothetical protein WCC17_05500 [Candidatus Nitrosopolaris sp.]|jgi:hypothetical protein
MRSNCNKCNDIFDDCPEDSRRFERLKHHLDTLHDENRLLRQEVQELRLLGLKND